MHARLAVSASTLMPAGEDLPPRHRFDSVQAMRGVAAILVVVYHLASFETVDWPARAVLGPVFRFAFAGIDLLFVISGFVLTWRHHDDFGRLSVVADYALRRAWRIYPTFWVAWIACVALTLRFENVLSPPGAWRSFFLVPAVPFPFPQLPPAWSLVHEMVFYAVFALLIALPRALFVPCLLLWVAASIGQALHPLSAPTSRSSLLLYPLTIEFALGCFAALVVRSGRCTRPGIVAALGIGLAIVGSAVGWRLGIISDLLWRAATFGGGSALLVIGLASDERASGRRPPRWMIVLGDASYSTFLAHWPAFLLVVILYPGIITDPPPHALVLASLFGIMMGSGFLLHRFVEEPAMRLGRRIFADGVKGEVWWASRRSLDLETR